MVTAKFGSKQFKVTGKMIYTPSDISISESIDIEETERSGKKPSTKIKGIKLQTVGFAVILDARFVTISTEIQWWKNTLRAKLPKDLYIGNYKIGRFYLNQYDLSDIQINKNGVYTKAKLSLSFTESQSSGSNQKSSEKTVKESEKKVKESVKKVKASAKTKTTPQIKQGSTVKTKKDTRIYLTSNGALNKKGLSERVKEPYESTVKKVTSEKGKVVTVQIVRKAMIGSGTGWMRAEDVTVVKY